ncbi:MAG TPA: sulfotransferase [Candidatus Binatia bacterium]|nr:sulfotransferase [Candidatus Binatia bacterium]
MTNEQFSGPLFVIGMWRSGTSLLYTLLNQHTEVALMYESDLFLLRSLFGAGGGKADWLERWEFWNNGMSRHNIDAGSLPARAASYSQAATEVWRQYSKGALYGEKSPNYFDSLQPLAREFPKARFLVIWRDLNDTCRSIAQAGKGSSFFAKRGITHRALIGYRKMKRECDALERRGVPLHQIYYEEMVQSPEIVMRGICAFLDIEFEPRMISLIGADRSAIYDAPQHAGVKSEKIGLNGNGKDKAALDPELRAKIARYIAHWKDATDGAWPVYPRKAEAVRSLGIAERASDEIYYRALRFFDRFTAFVYCYAPIPVLRRYRGAKAQPAAEPESKALQEPALTQASNQN